MMGLSPEQAMLVEEAEREQIPLKRRGVPDDIARWIVHLSDPNSNWITGQVMTVDGGLSLTWAKGRLYHRGAIASSGIRQSPDHAVSPLLLDRRARVGFDKTSPHDREKRPHRRTPFTIDPGTSEALWSESAHMTGSGLPDKRR